MVVDYCERKQVNRSKPKAKSSIGLYLLFFLILLGTGYGLGFGTAWYLFRYNKPASVVAKTPPVSSAAQKPAAPPQEVSPVPAAAPAQKSAEVPLTFYETLPKGGKSLIGTGINAPKEKPVLTEKIEKGISAPGQKSDKSPASQEHGQPMKENRPVDAKVSGNKSSELFLVQVSSSKDRKDAEETVAKLTGKGIAAYLAESKLEGKGTWYRVRVGRHLSRQEADAIAAKVGKGALVVPEQ